MPESYTNAPRETRTLHAPWWSEAKDASGQWLERVEVWYPSLERDSQWVNAKISGASTVSKAQAATGSMTLAGSEKYRMFLLMRMVVALTNRQGVNVLPASNAADQARIAWWQGVPERDTKWLFEQLEALNEPATPTLPEDEDEAARNATHNNEVISQAAAQGVEPPAALLKETDPAALAEQHFRQVS
jgi:hypothetical protein